jgi:hypothetical protein
MAPRGLCSAAQALVSYPTLGTAGNRHRQKQRVERGVAEVSAEIAAILAAAARWRSFRHEDDQVARNFLKRARR